jgi:hypothetical protein
MRNQALGLSVFDGRLESSKRAACSAPVTGRPAFVDRADLSEHASLIPIDALEGNLLILVKADHHDKRDRHFAPRRLHPRQESWNVAVMGEAG